jgi:hypothetical protein
MAATVPHAKFLFTDINPESVVPVSIDDLLVDGEPPTVLRDPHPDYQGEWRYEGMDGDSYVYREQLEDTVTGAGGRGYTDLAPAGDDRLAAEEGVVPPAAERPRGVS